MVLLSTFLSPFPLLVPSPLLSRICRGLQPGREGNIFSLQVWTVSIFHSFLISHSSSFPSPYGSLIPPHTLLSSFISPLTLNRWVLLKNVHLAPQWLVQLEKKLHSITTHSNFRLFLTMEINPKVGADQPVASSPCPFKKLEKRAWYLLFVHVLKLMHKAHLKINSKVGQTNQKEPVVHNMVSVS